MPIIETITLKNGDTVDIRSDATSFTAYDSAGRPIGTIMRPRPFGSTDRTWRAYRTDGTLVKESAFPLFRAMLKALRAPRVGDVVNIKNFANGAGGMLESIQGREALVSWSYGTQWVPLIFVERA